jgi:hypothetical protein
MKENLAKILNFLKGIKFILNLIICNARNTAFIDCQQWFSLLYIGLLINLFWTKRRLSSKAFREWKTISLSIDFS